MKTLKFGSSGPLVQFLQNILQKLGFYNYEINGSFDTNTQNSVIAFQNRNNIPADGIVGFKTWLLLTPYINGALGFIVPTNISYSYSILQLNIRSLLLRYPFLEVSSEGNSVLGNEISVIKIGTGPKEVFYSASIHANEWITTSVLMKFLEDYCYAYTNGLDLYGYSANALYNSCSIYIMPMVNPDGVDFILTDIYSCCHLILKSTA